MQCVKSIYETNGLKGCYRGLSVHVLREFPSSAVYFAVYELGRRKLNPRGMQDPTREKLACFMSGGLSGVISWTMIMPIDVVKSTFQASPSHKSVLACTREIYKRRGVKAFFTGTATAALRAFPVNAVTFFVYEEFLIFMSKIRMYKSNM